MTLTEELRDRLGYVGMIRLETILKTEIQVLKEEIEKPEYGRYIYTSLLDETLDVYRALFGREPE